MTIDPMGALRTANPVPADAHPFLDQPLDDRARRELRQLKAPRQSSSRYLMRRSLVLAAAVAATALAVAMLVTNPFATRTAVAQAATPPLLPLQDTTLEDAASRMTELAAAAAASDRRPGQPRTVSWQEWSLATRIDGDQVRSAVVPQEVSLTWSADHAGSLSVIAGETYFPDDTYREAWSSTGAPGEQGTVLRDETYAAGEFRPMYADVPPTTDAAMRSYFREAHPIDDIGTPELFVAISDLHREWQLNSEQSAAVLRQVAAAPDVVLLGGTTDRLGRPGEAFAVESDYSGLPTRYVLVFDQTTGKLLASEEWLMQTAGKLGVSIPAVISYTVWT